MKQKVNNTDQIPEGAFLVARKFFNDELWRRKPSSWTKIFIYILGKVNHTDHGGLKRGEGFFNFSEEIRNMGIDITPDRIKKFLCFAREKSILDTTRSTRGMIVKVLNYNTYQNLENYRSTSEAREFDSILQKIPFSRTSRSTRGKEVKSLNNSESQTLKNFTSTTGGTSEAREKHERSTPIYKNDKNEKNVSEEEKFTPPTLNEVIKYFIEKGYTDEIANKAWNYYDANKWRDSKGNKVKNWKQKMASWFDDKNKIVVPGFVDLSKLRHERQNRLS